MVYAVPSNEPFVLKIKDKEEFEKQSKKQYEKFMKLMKEIEKSKLNVKYEEKSIILRKKLINDFVNYLYY